MSAKRHCLSKVSWIVFGASSHWVIPRTIPEGGIQRHTKQRHIFKEYLNSFTLDRTSPPTLRDVDEGNPPFSWLFSRQMDIFYGLPGLLPEPSFCLQDSPGLFRLPVPVKWVNNFTGQHISIGLLLQLEGTPCFRGQPPDLGDADTTGTTDCAYMPK